jgi:chorismate mutase/prephenate dehydrogenase
MDLEEIRRGIDGVDRRLIALLAERKALVEQVSTVKKEQGQPIYVPEREAALLAGRRLEAQEAGLSPDLVEDLLRRIMRESYRAEGRGGFRSARSGAGKVVIVGGAGGMGRLFGQAFADSGYQVVVLERQDWPQARQLLQDAHLVLVSVPIDATVQVLGELRGLVPAEAVLADLTSLKREPVAAMMEIHQGPVLGLHPMFGPTTGVMAKQVIAYCAARFPAESSWVREQFQVWGARLRPVEPTVHDELMVFIQAMRHLATFVYGVHLADEAPDLREVLAFSSPIYRMELAMVGRLFAQSPGLYGEIIFSSPGIVRQARGYLQRFQQALSWVEQGDKAAFHQAFAEVTAWFGELGQQFLRESTFTIEKAHDHVV